MKNYEICIVGLGYVGLPLAIAFAKKYSVTAYDINKSRVLELQENFDHTKEITAEDNNKANKNIKFTHKHSDIEKCNVYIITVPTPIDSYNKPNLKPLIESSGFKIGDNFFLVYSPEREDPGNKDYSTGSIPKIIGGITPICREMGIELYSKIIEKLVPAAPPQGPIFTWYVTSDVVLGISVSTG